MWDDIWFSLRVWLSIGVGLFLLVLTVVLAAVGTTFLHWILRSVFRVGQSPRSEDPR